MKHLLMLATTATIISCSTQAQDKKETLEGNGKLVTREVTVQPFTELKADGVFELHLKQGSTEGVTIEADENLQELFTVSNESGKLLIDTKRMKNLRLRNENRMKVYVTFKNLNALQLSTVGNVKSEGAISFTILKIDNTGVGNVTLNLKGSKLDMDNSSVGNITLEGSADEAIFKNTGVGNLKAGDFEVATVTIANTGVGNAEINASKKVTATDSFLGKIKNRGSAELRKKNKVVI